jgi:glycerol kinase
MAGRFILAIDQGTTNTKAVLIDERAAVVSAASRPVEIAFPQPGWVEQDAEAIWRSVEGAVADCLGRGRRPAQAVDAVALTNQRESAVIWERSTGKPAGPVIVWQCRRTAGACDSLRARGAQPLVESKTGLTVDPLFSATKMRWLLEAIPNGSRRADAGELCGGTIDSWLLWKLTGGAVHACDVTNASRTQLLNLRTVSWDDELLALFEIPAVMLPAVRPSSGVCGHVTSIPALAGTPIAAMIGDSHAALFGHAAFEPGQVKATYGTGSSLMTPLSAPVRSRHGLSTTIAWSVGGDLRYALEGNITVTGSAVEWMSAIVAGPDRSSAGIAAMAASVADTGGVYFVPALAGLGAPYWDADARGLVCGLSRGTGAAHLARASVESIAYQVRDVFDAMGEDTGSPSALLVDGGASMNDALMQFQADIIGRPVIRAETPDLAALGAAWIAGLAIGVWASPAELEALPRQRSCFQPRMAPGERERLYDGWRAAVRRTRTTGADRRAQA